MKSIIAFYTKAKAHLQLSDFYDACAQVRTTGRTGAATGVGAGWNRKRNTVDVVAVMGESAKKVGGQTKTDSIIMGNLWPKQLCKFLALLRIQHNIGHDSYF